MIEVQAVELQDVQAPSAVRAAFDDVVSAIQDASRHVNEAEGYRNQVIPNARAEAIELIESANGATAIHASRQASGEAARFTAINWLEHPQGARRDAQTPLPRGDGVGAAGRGEGDR